MKKVSVYEYATLIGVTPKTVYKMIDKGEVITTKEIVNNREVIRIVFDSEESLSKYTQIEEITVGNIGNSQSEIRDISSSKSHIPSANLELILEDYVSMRKDLITYAELAGQAKLLTDSEHRTKQEYFQVIQENKQMAQEKARLEATTQILSSQIEELKKETQAQADLKAQLELYKQKLKEVEDQKRSWWQKL